MPLKGICRLQHDGVHRHHQCHYGCFVLVDVPPYAANSMSLYGDLPAAKDGTETGTSWSSAAAKLQPAFRKPSSVLGPPPSVLRGGRGAAGRGPGPPPTGRGAGRGPPPSSIHGQSSDAAVGSLLGEGGPIVVSSLTFFSVNGEPIKDEYDPSRPNDYEVVREEREAKRKQAEEEADRQAKLREIEQEVERRRKEQAEAAALVLAAARPPPGAPVPTQQPIDEEAEALYALSGAAASSSGAAGPGPGSTAAAGAAAGAAALSEAERQRRLALSGEEAFAARARLGRGGGAAAAAAGPGSAPAVPAFAAAAGQGRGPPGGGAVDPKGMTLAQRMLEKMGWKEGEGLGRNRQGISAPLVAQKTAQHAAVIVQAPEPEAKRAKVQGATFSGPPTKVVVLRNMVGPGEVDEALEEEVGGECTKYGTVADVCIFEVITPGYPAEEAVRIFVKFERVEAATRALVDLQGRFFGGRQVRAAFFSEERFDTQQLAPQAGEFGNS